MCCNCSVRTFFLQLLVKQIAPVNITTVIVKLILVDKDLHCELMKRGWTPEFTAKKENLMRWILTKYIDNKRILRIYSLLTY